MNEYTVGKRLRPLAQLGHDKHSCSGGNSRRGHSNFWSGVRDAAIPAIDDCEPMVVFDAAFDGEQGVHFGFRPAACLFESAADDLLADAFHDAGSDRQSALPVKIMSHSVHALTS